jgi:very-short-patch-repair endonuclease
MSNEIVNINSMREIRRELRQTETNTERLLWNALRNRQLAGKRFCRQQSIGTYVVDFYCAEANLVVELDGSVHDTPEAQRYDREREDVICDLGLTMLRFRNDDVEQRMAWVLEPICKTIIPPPHPPTPSPGGGEELHHA